MTRRDKRIVFGRQPACQFEPAALSLAKRRLVDARQDRRKAARRQRAGRQVIAPQGDGDIGHAAFGHGHRLGDFRIFSLGLLEQPRMRRALLGGHEVRGAVDQRVIVAVDDLLEVGQPERRLGAAQSGGVPLGIDAVRKHRPCALEDAGQRVVVGHRERIELVVVATGATHGQCQKSTTGGVELLIDDIHLLLDGIVFGQHLRPDREKARGDDQFIVARRFLLSEQVAG